MISQQQVQKQGLKILPQQIQLLNLYFLNTLELEQRMKTEMEENPFIDQNEDEEKKEKDELNAATEDAKDFQDYDEFMYDDVPDYKSEYQNYFSDGQTPEIAISSSTHFRDDLKTQLHTLNIEDSEMEIAEYLIDVLDSHGFMDKDVAEVADDLGFHMGKIVNPEDVQNALEKVKGLEPLGVGVKDVKECLQVQLEQMDSSIHEVNCALRLVRDHYDDLMHRQFEKIHHALGIKEEELPDVLTFIGKLKFHPIVETAGSFEPKTTIIPDFIISRQGGNLRVNLYSSRANSLYVNQTLYDQLSNQTSKKDKGAKQYVKSKLASAQWFVNAVRQREDTMMRIMETIVEIQEDYFQEGDIRALKPMVLRIVSEKAGLDISTISRITSNKYADTHFGLVYLKDLFSEGIANQKGTVISNKVIQSVIQEAIDAEDKKQPHTDQQLVNILKEKGYNIARRTVAKYREQMQVPIAQIRAVWSN